MEQIPNYDELAKVKLDKGFWNSAITWLDKDVNLHKAFDNQLVSISSEIPDFYSNPQINDKLEQLVENWSYDDPIMIS